MTPPIRCRRFSVRACARASRTAINLAWKLDLVLDGPARRPCSTPTKPSENRISRVIVEAAVGFGRMICTLDHDEAATRDASLLEDGPQHGREAPAMPGELMPQGRVRLGDDRVMRFDDAFGAGWRLVTDSTCRLTRGSSRSADASWSSEPTSTTSTTPIDRCCASGAPAVLQRPDFGVFGAGEPDTLVKELRDYLGG